MLQRVVQIIQATSRATTAEVRLSTEITDRGVSRALDRTLEGVVDFRSHMAHLRTTESAMTEGQETLIAEGRLYRRSAPDQPWLLGCEHSDLVDDGFGVLAFARSADEIIESEDLPGGSHSLRLRSHDAEAVENGSTAEILQVPTIVLSLPLLIRLDADGGGRAVACFVKSENQPRAKVARRCFGVEFQNFGSPVAIRPPDPAEVVEPSRHVSFARRLRRSMGFPESPIGR